MIIIKVLKKRIVLTIHITCISFLIYTCAFLNTGDKVFAYDYIGRTIPVSPGDSLRNAIASASDGDTIAITGDASGVFKEIFIASTPIIINKSIKIMSASTPVDLCIYASTNPTTGYGTASAIFQVTAPDVTIENFSAFRIGGETGEAVGSSENISAFIQVDSTAARFALKNMDNISVMAASAAKVTKKIIDIDGTKDVQIQNSAFSYPSTASATTIISAVEASNLQISGSTFNISSVNSFGISCDGGNNLPNLSITNSNFNTNAKTGITSVSASNLGTLSMAGSDITMAYSTQTGLNLNNINNLNIAACNFLSSAATAKHIVGIDIEHTKISEGSAFTILNSGRICDISKNTKGTSFILSDTAINMNFKNTFGFTLSDIGSISFSGNEINNPTGCTTIKTVTIDGSDSVKLKDNIAKINSNLVSAFEIFQTPSVELSENKFMLNGAGSVGTLIDAKEITSLSVLTDKNEITTTAGTLSNTTYGIHVKAGSAAAAVLKSSNTSMNLSAASNGIAADGLTSSSFTNDDATFTAAANASKGIDITGGANASITDCDVTMDGRSSEGISVHGTNGITFTNCNVDIVGGITAYPDKGIVINSNAGVIPKNLMIDGQKTSHIRVHSQAERAIGIQIESVDGATIKDIEMNNNYNNDGGAHKNYAAYGMRLLDSSTSPKTHMMNDILVTGCTFYVSGIRGIGLSASGLLVGTPPENTYSIKNLTVRKNVFNVHGKDGGSDNTTAYYRGDSDRCFGLNVTRQDNCIIEDNTVNIDGEFSKGISTGQGITNQVRFNTIHGLNMAWMGYISDGMGSDKPGVSAYRDDETLFEENVFRGSFTNGMYISSNGNTIRNNDLNKASFQALEISLVICGGARILNNHFAPAASRIHPVIRLTEGWVAETSGNTFYFADSDAEYVLAIEGNAVRYVDNSIDEYSVIENENTIGEAIPIETETAREEDNSTQYSYILRLPRSLSLEITKQKPDGSPLAETGFRLYIDSVEASNELGRANPEVTGQDGKLMFVIDEFYGEPNNIVDIQTLTQMPYRPFFTSEITSRKLILVETDPAHGYTTNLNKQYAFTISKNEYDTDVTVTTQTGSSTNLFVTEATAAKNFALVKIQNETDDPAVQPPDLTDTDEGVPKTEDYSNLLVIALMVFTSAAILLFIKYRKSMCCKKLQS